MSKIWPPEFALVLLIKLKLLELDVWILVLLHILKIWSQEIVIVLLMNLKPLM
jgi:hypothetical protein